MRLFKLWFTKLAGSIDNLENIRRFLSLYYHSRAFYIAISFTQQKRYKESAALVNKTELYMEQAKKTVKDGQQPKSSEIDYQVRFFVRLESKKTNEWFGLFSHY